MPANKYVKRRERREIFAALPPLKNLRSIGSDKIVKLQIAGDQIRYIHNSTANTAAIAASETGSKPFRKNASKSATAVPAMPDQMEDVQKRMVGKTMTASTL